MAARPKSPLPEEFDGLEFQEYPELLPRQKEAYSRLLQARPGSYTILGYGGGMGGGKAHDINELIPTPSGYTRHGDLRPGDLVFDEHGQITTVRVVHPITTPHKAYRLTFDDGSTIVVSSDHLWFTTTAAERKKAGRRTPEFGEKHQYLPPPVGAVRTTQEIADTLLNYQGYTNHAIPVAQALDLPPAHLPVDPYVLGVWLADGTADCGQLTGIDPEIWQEIERAGFEVRHRKDGRHHYIIGLTPLLRQAGVLKNKHIPVQYTRASKEQRLALLQGLMDTDGTVCGSGSVEFTNTNKRIIDGVYDLICGLGFKARVIEGRSTLNGKDCGPKWDIKWTPPEYVFRLRRKREKQKLGTRATIRHRYIVAADEVDPIPMRCITVDNQSGLYLAGPSMLVTHNSIFLSTIANQFLLSYPGTRILLCRDTLKALKETTMLDFLSMLPRQLILKYNQSENWLRIRRETWPEGVYSQINFMGVHDYEAIGSAAYQIILLDEAHEIPSEAARFLLTRLRWQLPRRVKDALRTQCRHVEPDGNGGWTTCGRRFPDGICPAHGRDWISDQVPYYFVATANPWPGWYTEWFWKRSMDDALAALGDQNDVSLHFVQSLMRDNYYLPRNYEALNTVGLTPEERRRFIDGEFGVFTGMVYEAFDRKHQWWGPIPQYTRVIGGLDFGNETSTGHFTAGVVQVISPNGRVLLVDEFKKRGPKVYEQLQAWMIKMQEKWGAAIGKKIEWRGDKNQSLGLKYMRDLGFNVTKSNKAGEDRVDAGIRHVSTFLNYAPGTYPGFFYLPDGHELGGCPEWEKEIKEYRRDPETLKIVKENDHLMDAWRYSFELVGTMSGDPSKMFQNALPQMMVA